MKVLNSYVVSMDFQTFGAGEFENENRFALSFGRSFLRLLKRNSQSMSEQLKNQLECFAQILREEQDNFRLQRLFESLMGKLSSYPELNDMLKTLLFTGKSIVYNADNSAIDNATMFGFIVNNHGTVAIANRIFGMRLCNYYLSMMEMQNFSKIDVHDIVMGDKTLIEAVV